MSKEIIILSLLVFISFLNLSCIDKRIDIWWTNHVVEQITCSSTELNRTWRLIAIKIGPLISNSLEAFEHWCIEFNKSFGNDWLILSLSSLNTHHGWEWATSCYPIFRFWISKVFHTGHVTRAIVEHEICCVHSNGITVLGIKVRWKSASAFISKEMTLWEEFALVNSNLSSIFEFSHDHQNKESLCINLGHLDISMRISIKQELARN